jgi:hypothetical protein
MPARTPEERALVARIASRSRWGKEPDRVAATEAMRRGRRAKYEAQVLAILCVRLFDVDLEFQAAVLSRASSM